MKKTNNTLHKAHNNKFDEFYTQLSDIENEVCEYKQHFRNKTVLCNCDDPRASNFFKFFFLHFRDYELKRLICTCYKNNEPDLFSQKESEEAVYLDYSGDETDLTSTDFAKAEIKPLHSDGDFRSKECIELLKQADIVVTNPPFSLFREYVAQLIEYDKKFLIIGNINAVTYKEIFPLIKDNKMWLGVKWTGSQKSEFIVPEEREDTNTKYQIINGKRVKTTIINTASWFTNLDHKKRHEKLVLYKKYTPDEYPKYDNYDAINVNKITDIPIDYDGVMGVPISFIGKYNPEQFEIVSFRKGEDGKDLVFTRERESSTILSYPCSTAIAGMIKNAEGKINGKITYARITIKRK